jgi:mannosylglycerate hydrolase
MIRYKCLVAFSNIPALGYRTFVVAPAKHNNRKSNKIARNLKQLPILENEKVKIEINSNGTINFYNKQSDIHIKNTGYIYDEGEAGHAWVNKPIKPYITTLKSKPAIKIISNNHLAATCKISYKLNIPENLSERKKKNGKSVKQNIDLFITLLKDSERVDYILETNNIAESHRLRIMFPTGIESDFSYGEGQFDVVKRSTHRGDTSSWIEQPMYDYPMHHFIDLSDGEKGAAVLVDGLKEYEILKDRQTIAITLLRCFEYVIQPSSVEKYMDMKGSQCPGKHKFRFSFFPHRGDWTQGEVFKEALKFNYQVRSVQSGNNIGTLPSSASFINISSTLIIMSCFKNSGDGYLLRLYNPTEKEISTDIQFLFPILKAEIVTLEEKPVQELIIQNKRSNIKLNKKQILSIKLKFST